MEILVRKISENHDDPIFYNGVIAYGKAVNGKTYVLRTQPKAIIDFDSKEFEGDEIPEILRKSYLDDSKLDYLIFLRRNWFVICQSKGTKIIEIFKEDDEMGEGLIFDGYDEAIYEFKNFLNKL